MKKLLYVHLVLENVEVLKFDADDIHFVSVENIHKNIVFGNNYLHESIQCDGLYLKVYPSGNKMENNITGSTEKSLPFERIKLYQDVVSIELFYDNQTSESICVPYDGEEVNSLQTLKITPNGSMVLTINKTLRETEDELSESVL